MCGMKDWVEDGIRYVVLFYKTEKFEGDLISSEEGSLVGGPERIAKSRPLLRYGRYASYFLEEDLSEFFYYQDGEDWKYDLK